MIPLPPPVIMCFCFQLFMFHVLFSSFRFFNFSIIQLFNFSTFRFFNLSFVFNVLLFQFSIFNFWIETWNWELNNEWFSPRKMKIEKLKNWKLNKINTHSNWRFFTPPILHFFNFHFFQLFNYSILRFFEFSSFQLLFLLFFIFFNSTVFQFVFKRLFGFFEATA